MKNYILLFLLLTLGIQAQTLPSPAYNNTTTNTLKIKTPATVTSVNFLPAFDSDGFTLSKISTDNIPLSTETINAINTQDATVLHKTGNETKTGTLTLIDGLLLSSPNALSANTNTGFLKMLDVGSVRNNLTLSTDLANIRLEMLSSTAHLGVNKGGTVNSSLAMLFDPANGNGHMDFRGTGYISGVDTDQYSRIGQNANDFEFRNYKSGAFLFKSAGVVNNVKIQNDGKVGVGGVATSATPLSRFHVDGGNIAVGGSSATSGYEYYNSASALRASSTWTGSSLDISTLTATPINFKTNGTTVGSFASSGSFNVVNLTASRVVVTDASKNLASSAVTSTELGYLSGVTSSIPAQFGLKAPLASPALAGTPTAPTATTGTNTTQLATTAFVQDAITASSTDIQDIVDASTKTGLVDGGNSQISMLDGSVDNRTFSVVVSPGTGGSSISINNISSSLITEITGGLVGGFRSNLGTPFMGLTKPGFGTTEVSIEEPMVNSNWHTPSYSVSGNYKYASQPKEYLVSVLPTPTGSDSRFAIVTDALAPTYMATIVGGGTVVCPVFYNGTAWVAN